MNFKKILACTFALLLCCGVFITPQVVDNFKSVIAFAEDEENQYTGSCGENATYFFDETTGTLTISGTGDMDNYLFGTTPWKKDNIKSIIIEEGITSVGGYSFNYCSNLVNVTLPNSLKFVGEYAFANCYNLSSIIIPSEMTYISNYAFGYKVSADICGGKYDGFLELYKIENFVIYGVSDSWSEHYANRNGLTFNSIANIDLNVKLLLLKKSLLKISAYPYLDINGDSSVDIIDLIELKSQILNN